MHVDAEGTYLHYRNALIDVELADKLRSYSHQSLLRPLLEPVDGSTIYDIRVGSNTVTELVPNRAQSQNYVQVMYRGLDHIVIKFHWRCLLSDVELVLLLSVQPNLIYNWYHVFISEQTGYFSIV
jgi:hypothetical protein